MQSLPEQQETGTGVAGPQSYHHIVCHSNKDVYLTFQASSKSQGGPLGDTRGEESAVDWPGGWSGVRHRETD